MYIYIWCAANLVEAGKTFHCHREETRKSVLKCPKVQVYETFPQTTSLLSCTTLRRPNECRDTQQIVKIIYIQQ